MSKPEFATLIYEVSDRIATITLNRPDRLNAFTTQMMADMIAAFDLADGDDDVRAVIVTGAGRGFCAGADDDVVRFDRLAHGASPQPCVMLIDCP